MKLWLGLRFQGYKRRIKVDKEPSYGFCINTTNPIRIIETFKLKFIGKGKENSQSQSNFKVPKIMVKSCIMIYRRMRNELNQVLNNIKIISGSILLRHINPSIKNLIEDSCKLESKDLED